MGRFRLLRIPVVVITSIFILIALIIAIIIDIVAGQQHHLCSEVTWREASGHVLGSANVQASGHVLGSANAQASSHVLGSANVLQGRDDIHDLDIVWPPKNFHTFATVNVIARFKTFSEEIYESWPVKRVGVT